MIRKAGFTLIEILVVVAIILILAAILLPVVLRAKEPGLKVNCTSNLLEIGRALKTYQEDYGVYPDTNNPMQKLIGSNREQLQKLLTCPKDPENDAYSDFYNYWGYQPGISPEPIQTRDEAKSVYVTLINPATGKQDYWTLSDASKVVPPNEGIGDAFPGLVNPRAPAETIVTICPHHAAAFKGKFLILRRVGVVDFYKPADDMFWALSKKAL